MLAPALPRLARPVLGLAALALLAGPGPAQSVRYAVTEIGAPFGHTGFTPVGVSNAGVVAGNTTGLYNGQVQDRAAVWSSGTFTVLQPFSTPSQAFTTAYGISATGTVAGSATSSNFGYYSGFTYSAGVMTNLGAVSGSVTSVARGVSSNGLVAGWSGSYAVVGNGTFTNATAIPGPPNQQAYGVNDFGQVIGYGNGGWIYSGGPQTTALPLLSGATATFPKAINNAGTVVGFSGAQAFMYHSGTITGLGILPGTSESVALSVNGSDVAVGYSSSTAVLFENGTVRSLNSLIDPGNGWSLSTATGINDSGWIVGVGTHNGQTTGFLLTPVPEPVGLLAVAAAVGLTATRGRLRR